MSYQHRIPSHRIHENKVEKLRQQNDPIESSFNFFFSYTLTDDTILDLI